MRDDTALVLRISVTEYCNFRCRYCVSEDGRQISPRGKQLPLSKLLKMVSLLAGFLRIEKIKITGGEPLVRAGVAGFVEQLMQVEGVREVSMTTNGSLLARHADSLKRAGLSRVNVSLDTLNPVRFRELTGAKLEQTLVGINAAERAGLSPVKLNAVLMNSSWREDVPALLDFAAHKNMELRFIELMQTGSAASWAEREIIRADEIIEWLGRVGIVKEIPAETHAPARINYINWKSAKVKVGWITPQSKPFCEGCNRLRLDSQGRLHRCLMDPHVLSLLRLADRFDDEVVSRLVTNYIDGKKAPVSMKIDREMLTVGG